MKIILLLAMLVSACGQSLQPQPFRVVGGDRHPIVSRDCPTYYDPTRSWCAQWDSDPCCVLLLSRKAYMDWGNPVPTVPNLCRCVAEKVVGPSTFSCTRTECRKEDE